MQQGGRGSELQALQRGSGPLNTPSGNTVCTSPGEEEAQSSRKEPGCWEGPAHVWKDSCP